MTWRSINCAYVRLAQIVGLNRVVDTTYRMAQSVYLYPGQPAEERRPIEPFVSYSTGANEMSPLDMASGAQTIANGGLHHEPYYVEDIDAADGRRIYTHADAGTQVLDRGVALTAVDVLKGVLQHRHRPALPARPRPAAGKTGTQEDNTNAWFVGFTPELTTSVWVGDPERLHADGEHPRVRGRQPRRACRAAATRRRSGRRTWTPALAGRAAERLGGAAAPTPGPPARLYLPGQRVPGPAPSRPVASVLGTVPPAPPPGPAGFAPAAAAAGTTAAAGRRRRPRRPRRCAARASEITGTAAVTRLVPIESGTTVPPDVLDPRAPIPSTPLSSSVIRC